MRRSQDRRRSPARTAPSPVCAGLILALSTGAASAQQTAGIGAADVHRAVVDGTAHPWASVGKLFNSIGGACTASVIAPDKVLTAAHCLYAFRTHRFLPASAIHFLLGYDRGSYRVHARVARYRIGRGFDPDREQGTAAADQAVLFLTDPLPGAVKPLRISTATPGPGTPVALGGFGQDRAYVMTADTRCAITGRIESGKIILHDCRIAPGDSGAPLLMPVETGLYEVLAVAVGTFQVGAGRVGVAAVVSPDTPARLAP